MRCKLLEWLILINFFSEGERRMAPVPLHSSFRDTEMSLPRTIFWASQKGKKVIWKCNRMLEGCLPSIDNDENAPIPNVTQWFLNLRASLLWRKDVGNPAKILPCGCCGYVPARMWGYSNSHRVTGFYISSHAGWPARPFTGCLAHQARRRCELHSLSCRIYQHYQLRTCAAGFLAA